MNTASTSGRPPSGAVVTDTADAVVPLETDPQIALTKDATLNGDGAVGDTISYDFQVTNTGDVSLTGVGITDPLPGLSSVSYGPWPSTEGTLAPGQSVTATATYTVTQADLDRGEVANTATAAGNPPFGSPSGTPPTPTSR